MKTENIDAIIIHCSATKEGIDYRLADIDKWHRERGFKMVGYNYVIDLDGQVEIGRPITMDGAHCNTSGTSGKAYNKHSIGICYIGGLDKDGNSKDTRTLAQKVAMATLVYRLIEKYPIVEVLGHRDTGAKKDCPCFDVKSEFPIAICVAKK